jgi:AcrR family transcriptional regulator
VSTSHCAVPLPASGRRRAGLESVRSLTLRRRLAARPHAVRVDAYCAGQALSVNHSAGGAPSCKLPLGHFMARDKAAPKLARQPSKPSAESAHKAGGSSRQRAPRLSPKERERLIVAGAVRYFAEVGFEGDTRSLAKHLGVGNTLVFKYFPTKESLIERVYQEVFVGRWNPYWDAIITNRSKSLEARLSELYKSYARTVLDYEWTRLFMFAGLKKSGVNTRWLHFITEHLAKPICAEIRATLSLPDFESVPVTEKELELVLGISSRIVSFGLRKYIYGTPVPNDLDPIIEAEIEIFVRGSKDVIPAIVAEASGRQRKRR